MRGYPTVAFFPADKDGKPVPPRDFDFKARAPLPTPCLPASTATAHVLTPLASSCRFPCVFPPML